MRTITLATGQKIPQLGLGTWELIGDACERSVSEALQMGYTHIDTAEAYGNHKEVGKGIKKSNVSRDKIFLTTKIPMGKQKADQVRQLSGQMLKDLQTDYIDLLLIHWPTKRVPFEETLGAMNELIEKGVVKSIGVSNFNKDLVAKAGDVSEAKIVMNQVEFHPYLYQKELLEACEEMDVRITAYSPLARGMVLHDERLQEIGKKYDASAAQVAIAWLLSKDIIVIPKASSQKHLESNLKAMELQLSKEDIDEIDDLPEEERLIDASWKDYEF